MPYSTLTDMGPDVQYLNFPEATAERGIAES